jgi:hypothetical protein
MDWSITAYSSAPVGGDEWHLDLGFAPLHDRSDDELRRLIAAWNNGDRDLDTAVRIADMAGDLSMTVEDRSVADALTKLVHHASLAAENSPTG